MLSLEKSKAAPARQFHRISAQELGRPRARMGNPNTGIPEVVVQPEFDIYFVAAGSPMGLLSLFSVVQNQTYNFNGVAAFLKGPGHTTLLQPGMLESSYTYIVRALSVYVQGLQGTATPTGPQLNIADAINFLSSYMAFRINRKPYFEGIGAWLPCGGGAMFSGAGVGTIAAGSAVGNTTNGLPYAKNVYGIPGGQFINPQEQFDFIINPTLNAGGTPSATAAVVLTAGFPASGLSAWIRLDGTLIRVAQ
jgi:hypothetical protein